MAGNPSGQDRGPAGAGQGAAWGSTPMGSMYRAFDDFERQARQRKYMIAECEDIIENLQKELTEVVERNKTLEAECEKLEMAAHSAEANYEKKVKEKALMENQYRELAKEMDEATEEVARKQARLMKMKLFRQQKREQFKTGAEKQMKEYMKNPQIAKLFEYTKKADALSGTLKEKTLELERRKRESQERKSKHDEEWEAFKKSCVKLAEMHFALKEKKAALNKLRGDFNKTFRPTGTPRRDLMSQDTKETPATPGPPPRSPGIPIPVSSISRRMDGFQSRIGLTVPRQRRSSAFEQLDRVLCKSNALVGSYSDRRASLMASIDAGSSAWKKLCSPIGTGSTLVSQIRSKIKGTVTVRPMPRNEDVQMESNPANPTLSQTANVATINPTQMRSETVGANTNHPRPSSTSELVVTSSNEQAIMYESSQETVNTTQAETVPVPPPPTQQSVLSGSQQMDATEGESKMENSRSDQSNMELGKPTEVETVTFLKPGDGAGAMPSTSTTGDPTRGQSQQSNFSFNPFLSPPDAPSDGPGMFSFTPTETGSKGNNAGAFAGFFYEPPEQIKSPEFSFAGFF